MKKLIIDLKDTPFKKIYVSKYVDLSESDIMDLKSKFDSFIAEISNAQNITGLDVYISTPQRSGKNSYDKVYFEHNENKIYLKFLNYFYQEDKKSIRISNVDLESNDFVSFIKNKVTNNMFKVQNHHFKENNKNQFSISLGSRSIDIDITENEKIKLLKVESSLNTTPEYKVSNSVTNKDSQSFIKEVRKENHNGLDFYFVKLENLFISELLLVNNKIVGTNIEPDTYSLIRKYSTTHDLTTITQKYKMNNPITESYDSLYAEMNCFWEFEELIEDNNLKNNNIHLGQLVFEINTFINNNQFYQMSEKNSILLNNIFNEITDKETITKFKEPELSIFKTLDSYDINNIEFNSINLENIGELWNEIHIDLKISENKKLAEIKQPIINMSKNEKNNI